MRDPIKPLMSPDLGWSDLQARFRWPRHARFNIAEACCDVWARREPERLALRAVGPDGAVRDWRYGELARASQRLANVFAARGIGRGDRVAVLLPQVPEAALTHLAAYRLGAVVVPLFTLFGEDGLAYRLRDSGAKAVVTDRQNLPKIAAIREGLPELGFVLSIDAPEAGALGFWLESARAGQLPDGDDAPRRPGVHQLHLRNHRAAEGGAARASGADRASAGDRAGA
jgi:acetyl-CoA synthetase